MIGSRQLVDYIPVRGVACSGRNQQRTFAYGAASRGSGLLLVASLFAVFADAVGRLVIEEVMQRINGHIGVLATVLQCAGKRGARIAGARSSVEVPAIDQCRRSRRLRHPDIIPLFLVADTRTIVRGALNREASAH